MKIAIDLDSVLADLVPAMILFHNEKYKSNLVLADHTEYNLSPIWNCTPEEVIKRVFEFYYSPYLFETRPLPGSIEALNELKKDHELFVITARPTVIEKETLKWLDTHFPDTFSAIHHTNLFLHKTEKHIKKSEVCTQIQAEIMIEDNIDYAVDCDGCSIDTYLIEQPWNTGRPIPETISRVKDWQDLMKKFKMKYGQSKGISKSK